MKFTGKVIAAFLIWMLLGILWQQLYPTAYRRYSIGTFGELSDYSGDFKTRYHNLCSALIDLGFRQSERIESDSKNQTVFQGTYGNIVDAEIAVTLEQDPIDDDVALRIRLKYNHPRWKDKGSKYHKTLRSKVDQILTG